MVVHTDMSSNESFAHFHWKHLHGIMRFDAGVLRDDVDIQSNKLVWLLRDNASGKIHGPERNGEDCTGQITFDVHERTVMGMLYDVQGLGMMDFTGKRTFAPAMVKGHEFTAEWDRIVAGKDAWNLLEINRRAMLNDDEYARLRQL